MSNKCGGSCPKILLMGRMKQRLRLLRPHGLQLAVYGQLRRQGRPIREQKTGFPFTGKISRE